MGELIVVSGPPGAGKSAVATCLADRLGLSVLVPGDDFFGFLRRGAIAPWLPHSRAQNIAVVEAAAAASGRLARYCDVIYDGVVGPWFLPTFLRESQLDHVNFAVLLPPLQVCLDRVRTRTGHGFTDAEATEHMWHEFRRANTDGRYEFGDHAATPTHLAKRIAEAAETGLIRFPDGRPDHAALP